MQIFSWMMAFDGWTMLFSALILFGSSISKAEAQSCEDTSDKNYGVFTSPNYPNVYNTSTQCTYSISLPTRSSITINFDTFELDRSSNDSVSISCASNSSYGQKRYTWNSNIPPISIPWCSNGRIDFHSDSERNFSTKGFRVQYQVNTIGCGNTVFTSSYGTISSPNYPQNYNSDENCTYSIWAQEASTFTLTFEAFQLQEDCRKDWVQIKCDNSSYISPKYCGSSLPRQAYITNCSKVLIWFHTDNSMAFSGFSLQYSVTPDGCGKLTHGSLSGVITSPNYPKGYTGKYCPHKVYPVSSIALDFQAFDLEPFIDSKDGDKVWVLCHGYYWSDEYRGNSLPPLTSYSLCRVLYIEFISNYAISGTGFNVRYQVNPLIAHSAITNSPRNFTVVSGNRVELECTSNATGYYPSWTLNKDGTDENTEVIASFCRVNSDFSSRYHVITGGQGVCNLVMTQIALDQAGVYTCIDVSLASASSVVTVVDANTAYPIDQDQDDSDVTIIVLSVLLAICVLGYIGLAIRFTVRKYRNKSREEEGQRNTTQDTIPAHYSVGSGCLDPPSYVFSPVSAIPSERVNDGFDDPPAYEAL